MVLGAVIIVIILVVVLPVVVPDRRRGSWPPSSVSPPQRRRTGHEGSELLDRNAETREDVRRVQRRWSWPGVKLPR